MRHNARMKDVSLNGWLRSRLEESGLTVAALSARSGVSKATIHRALSEGYPFTPSRSTVAKLEAAFGSVGDSPAVSTPDAPPIALAQLPNGKARLQINKVVPYSLALRVLAMIEEGGE